MTRYTTAVLFVWGVVFPHFVSGQDNPLRIIEPTLRLAPPTLDESELKKALEAAEYAEQMSGEEPGERQKELLDWAENWAYLDTDDLLSVEEIGDGWWNCAGVDSVYATSSLRSSGRMDYGAGNANDWSLRTAWVEGADGYGIGESITWRFSEYTPAITTVVIYNGYAKSFETWLDNSRVRQLKLYINGQPYALLNLRDTYRRQQFDIGEHYGSGAVLKLEITDVYPGDRYDDVAISEIDFDGTGCLCFAKGTMISMPDGEKPIEQLRAGDTVLSLNTQTNEIETALVTGLAGGKHHLYELDFGDVKIETTADHPFWFEGSYYSIKKNSTYGVETQPFVVGQPVNYLAGDRIKTTVLRNITKLDRYETTYTVTELGTNRLFFANGLCVSTEKINRVKGEK